MRIGSKNRPKDFCWNIRYLIFSFLMSLRVFKVLVRISFSSLTPVVFISINVLAYLLKGE